MAPRRRRTHPERNIRAVVLAVDGYVAALTPDQFDQLVAPHPRPLMISIAMIGARHAKALLTATTDSGGTPLKALSDLVDSLGAVAKAGTITDPTNDLSKAVLAGTLRGDELDERIAQAAAQATAEYRAGLRQRAELAVMKEFVKAPQDGAADQIIDSLRPQYDAAAKALIGCGEIVDLNTDAEAFLAGTDEAGRQAWQAINTHVDVLNKIVSCVTQFGAKSTSFPLIEPTNLHGTAGIHGLASLCTDPQHDLAAASAVFHQPGSHRKAPWFLAAPALRLSSIAEAREKARAWSEAAWDALELNRGRGRFDPQKGFIPMPVKNPYAAAQPPAAKR